MRLSGAELRTSTMWGVVLLAVSVVLFGTALSQEAIRLNMPGPASVSGWRVLLQGWRGLSQGHPQWLANPLLLLSWLTFRRRKRWSLLLGCAAALLMLSFLPPHAGVHLAGSGTVRLAPGPGYWLWLGSALLAVGAALCGATRYDLTNRSARPI